MKTVLLWLKMFIVWGLCGCLPLFALSDQNVENHPQSAVEESNFETEQEYRGRLLHKAAQHRSRMQNARTVEHQKDRFKDYLVRFEEAEQTLHVLSGELEVADYSTLQVLETKVDLACRVFSTAFRQVMQVEQGKEQEKSRIAALVDQQRQDKVREQLFVAKYNLVEKNFVRLSARVQARSPSLRHYLDLESLNVKGLRTPSTLRKAQREIAVAMEKVAQQAGQQLQGLRDAYLQELESCVDVAAKMDLSERTLRQQQEFARQFSEKLLVAVSSGFVQHKVFAGLQRTVSQAIFSLPKEDTVQVLQLRGEDIGALRQNAQRALDALFAQYDVALNAEDALSLQGFMDQFERFKQQVQAELRLYHKEVAALIDGVRSIHECVELYRLEFEKIIDQYLNQWKDQLESYSFTEKPQEPPFVIKKTFLVAVQNYKDQELQRLTRQVPEWILSADPAYFERVLAVQSESLRTQLEGYARNYQHFLKLTQDYVALLQSIGEVKSEHRQALVRPEFRNLWSRAKTLWKALSSSFWERGATDKLAQLELALCQLPALLQDSLLRTCKPRTYLEQLKHKHASILRACEQSLAELERHPLEGDIASVPMYVEQVRATAHGLQQVAQQHRQFMQRINQVLQGDALTPNVLDQLCAQSQVLREEQGERGKARRLINIHVGYEGLMTTWNKLFQDTTNFLHPLLLQVEGLAQAEEFVRIQQEDYGRRTRELGKKYLRLETQAKLLYQPVMDNIPEVTSVHPNLQSMVVNALRKLEGRVEAIFDLPRESQQDTSGSSAAVDDLLGQVARNLDFYMVLKDIFVDRESQVSIPKCFLQLLSKFCADFEYLYLTQKLSGFPSGRQNVWQQLYRQMDTLLTDYPLTSFLWEQRYAYEDIENGYDYDSSPRLSYARVTPTPQQYPLLGRLPTHAYAPLSNFGLTCYINTLIKLFVTSDLRVVLHPQHRLSFQPHLDNVEDSLALRRQFQRQFFAIAQRVTQHGLYGNEVNTLQHLREFVETVAALQGKTFAEVNQFEDAQEVMTLFLEWLEVPKAWIGFEQLEVRFNRRAERRLYTEQETMLRLEVTHPSIRENIAQIYRKLDVEYGEDHQPRPEDMVRYRTLIKQAPPRLLVQRVGFRAAARAREGRVKLVSTVQVQRRISLYEAPDEMVDQLHLEDAVRMHEFREVEYRLVGVASHLGASAATGHYVALTWPQQEKGAAAAVIHDDERVSQVSTTAEREGPAAEGGLLLIYERISAEH
ncbi:MAG: hypothetical protein OXT67_02585 [Zetaproteobacteria bacterium]|nr:hypothetical protein [Zetaproteobacteria bacterium]